MDHGRFLILPTHQTKRGNLGPGGRGEGRDGVSEVEEEKNEGRGRRGGRSTTTDPPVSHCKVGHLTSIAFSALD